MKEEKKMLKKTKLYNQLRKIKNKFLSKKHYKYAKSLKELEFEDYLCNRYIAMMNKYEYTKGKKLNFENPQTFSEKCQWLKLYDQDPRKPILSDKYRVRKFVSDVIGDKYLTKLISIDGKDCFENANDINFSKLPNSFVLKCNHGSHMNIFVKNKSELTEKKIKKIKKQLNKWLKTDYMYVVGLETQYKGIKPLIIIEEYLPCLEHVLDYKFICFSGKPEFLWVDEGAGTDNSTTTTFDLNYNRTPFNMNLGYKPDISDFSKPKNFSKMIEIVKKLCSDFLFVRVDLYNINGEIYFGELTFNSAAGYDVPFPEKYDLELGKLLLIDNKKRTLEKK